MESNSLLEWTVGGVFVGVNAFRRYNTPASNRASTTFQNFSLYFLPAVGPDALCFFWRGIEQLPRNHWLGLRPGHRPGNWQRSR